MKIMQLSIEKLPTKKEINWLYITTKTVTIEYLKKNQKYIDKDSIYNISEFQSEIIELIDKDSFNTLMKNIDNTSKEIISLKIFSKFSFKEISELLNVLYIKVIWKYNKSTQVIKRKYKYFPSN